MMSIDDFKGEWKVCGWIPTESQNGLMPLIPKDTLIAIDILNPDQCKVTWKGPEQFSALGDVKSPFTYDRASGLLKVGATAATVSGQSTDLQGATAGLVCPKILAMTLTPQKGSSRFGDGEPGTFIAEAHPQRNLWFVLFWVLLGISALLGILGWLGFLF
jgi:hypothetical protein